jgi:predicted lactoylglutathione lyase
MVRYLINKQKFNSLWDLDSDIIKELTGKSFDKFQLQNTDVDDKILNSIIVILILETRFSSFSSLWYGIVQKARNRIIDLFGKDSNNIDKLFNDIRNKL